MIVPSFNIRNYDFVILLSFHRRKLIFLFHIYSKRCCIFFKYSQELMDRCFEQIFSFLLIQTHKHSNTQFRHTIQLSMEKYTPSKVRRVKWVSKNYLWTRGLKISISKTNVVLGPQITSKIESSANSFHFNFSNFEAFPQKVEI